MKKLIITFIAAACFNLASCAFIPVYKSNVQQGNVITPEMLAQLKLGMNTEQVRYIMGNPVLTNTFNPNRWDYIYTFRPGSGKHQKQHVTLYFKNGRLVNLNQSI